MYYVRDVAVFFFNKCEVSRGKNCGKGNDLEWPKLSFTSPSYDAPL